MSDHEPCCAACGGAGADMSGPCSDCYGTGCAHPPMSSVDRAAEVLIAHRRWRIQDCACGWAKPGESHTEHVVQCLDAAGALVTPAHDAAVIEKFLREEHTPVMRIENPEFITPLLAKAWDEGFKQGGPMHDVHLDDPDAHTRNPYRKGETDDRR